jgi:hypothetical protein
MNQLAMLLGYAVLILLAIISIFDGSIKVRVGKGDGDEDYQS